jgi:hypothetical protein
MMFSRAFAVLRAVTFVTLSHKHVGKKIHTTRMAINEVSGPITPEEALGGN